jgi:hypothetical protein
LTSATAGSAGGAAEPKPLSAKRMLRLIAANASVLTAALVYMGWAYQNAEYGHFGLNPQELNVGILEYMLYSLDSFSQVLVIAAVVVVAAGTVFAAVPDLLARQRSGPQPSAPVAGNPEQGNHPQEGKRDAGEEDPTAPEPVIGRAPQRRLAVFAFVITVVFATLWAVGFHFSDGSYVYLAVFGVGPLLFTRAYRDREKGRFAYATAIVLAAVCAMYAGALYAQAKGGQEAQTIAHGGGSMPHVTVYSEQPLGLSGHGIQAEPLLPGAGYHWRYEGLRLLTVRSGTYYLFPARPTSGPEPTYILDDSDGIRIVLNG